MGLHKLHNIFPRIVSFLEQLLPFNSCRSIYYIKVEFLGQLNGISYIFQLQKRKIVAALIQGNTVSVLGACDPMVPIVKQELETVSHLEKDVLVEFHKSGSVEIYKLK